MNDDSHAGTADSLLPVLKALAHPHRLALVALMQRPEQFPDNLVDPSTIGVCVNDLAKAAGLAQSTASYHLGALREAGLVEETPHGQWRYVRVRPDGFAGLADDIGALIETDQQENR